MMLLRIVWDVLAPIFLVAGTGFVGVRRLHLEVRTLSATAFYIFTPCLVFTSLLHIQLDLSAVGQIATLNLCMTAILITLGYVLSRIQQWDRQLRSACILAILIQNTGNYGIPVNRFAFGEAAVEIAVLHYALIQITANTLGVFITSAGTTTTRKAIWNLASVPLLYATLLALIVRFFSLTLPTPLVRGIELCAAAAIPILLILLGMQLAQLNIEKNAAPLAWTAALRLVFAPIAAVILTDFLGIAGVARQVSIIQWGVPTAVTTVVLASQYDCRPRVVAGAIFITTLCSFVTIPMLLIWLLPLS